MERRAFADGAVNQIGIGGIAESEHVRLNGNQQIGGRIAVMPAAARMMCSSCGRCMTETLLYLPDFLGAQDPREG